MDCDGGGDVSIMGGRRGVMKRRGRRRRRDSDGKDKKLLVRGTEGKKSDGPGIHFLPHQVSKVRDYLV